MVSPCSTRIECVLKSMLIALLTMSPMTYRLTRSVISDKISDAKGCPTRRGFVIHIIVFGLVSYLAYTFDLYETLRKLAYGPKVVVSSAEKVVEDVVDKVRGRKPAASPSSDAAAASSKSKKSALGASMQRGAVKAAFRSVQEDTGAEDDVSVTKLSEEKSSMRGYKTAGVLHTRSPNKVNALGNVTRSSVARRQRVSDTSTSRSTMRSAREQA